MATNALEGDWQFVSEKGYDPVKVTVKNIMGSEWIVACMIPKGNMMASMLKKVDGKFQLVKLNCSNRECPKENRELEAEFKLFLEQGISNVVREGKTLVLEAGGQRRVLVEDDMRKKHEDEQKAKLAAAKGSGRFG
eukprot:TRINITY_DN134_c0_g1_i2.p1 TRINITY_DN134_c0_g1~~TRINITY_DN134_c0_g1_i2.p1  ORF type:complete len:136 (+),score=50.89 TRINITY_DN134_c0_g1_i2:140-547(+)